jgi:aspartate-semialdehyde dehydrogenase
MKVLAIVHPGTLVAKELREQLERRPELWRELRLLTTIEEEVGVLTDVGGGAAVVQRASPETFAGADLLFLCGTVDQSREALAMAPPGCRGVFLAFDAAVDDAPPLVAGVNLADGHASPLVLSPHPGAILLAHLLQPLVPLGLRRAEATLLQPVSVFTAAALDQLFEQARSLLTFTAVPDADHWQRQLAFNLQPARPPAPAELGRVVETVLAGGGAAGLEVSTQVIQAGVFHSFAASVHLSFATDPGLEAVRVALSDQPWLRWSEEETLGPVDAAGAEEALLGHVRAEPGRAGSYWAWCVMDNLTRGGASNAVAIGEVLLGG